HGGPKGPAAAACRDACRGLAGARALDHVAHVLVAVLERSGEVSVAWPQPRHRVRRLGEGRHAHDALPVHGVAVLDPHGDRCAGGPSLPEAAGDAGAVPLDPLTRSASVPELAPAQVGIDDGAVEREPGRYAVDDDRQTRTVRLA